MENRTREFKDSLKNINFKDINVKKIYKKIIFFIIPILLIILVLQSVNFLFTVLVAPNSYFLGNNISFKDKTEVEEIIKMKKQELDAREIILTFDTVDKEITKKYYLKDLIDLDVNQEAIGNIFNKNFTWYDFNLKLFIKNIFSKKEYNLDYSISNSSIASLENSLRAYEFNVQNAKIIPDEQNLKFTIEKEQQGFIYDFNKFKKDILFFINSNNNKGAIKIDKIIENPIVTESDLSPILSSANSLIENSPITVMYRTVVYKITKNDLLKWIDFDYSIVDSKFNEAKIKIKKTAY